jgi:antitoxin HicB
MIKSEMDVRSKKEAVVSELERYVNKPYPIELLEDDQTFTASHPDLPGCVSFGESPDEAVAELKKVKTLWIKGRLDSGKVIPEPSSVDDFSGKFVLRIPRALHKSLDYEARQQNVSLNQYVSHVLSNRHSQHAASLDYDNLFQAVTRCVVEITLKARYSMHNRGFASKFRDDAPLVSYDTLRSMHPISDRLSFSTSKSALAVAEVYEGARR